FGQNQGSTTQNYRALFELPTIWGIIINTIVIAVVGGFVATTIAMGFAYARVRRTKAGAAISILTWVTYALPGLLLGIAMLWAFVPVPGLRTLYGTIWIVLIGLIVNTVPLSNRLGEASLEQLSPQLEEAARVSGASRLRAIRQVLVPLIAPSFFVGWLIALVMIIGNLDVPVLMAGPENETIAVRVFRFYTAGQITRAAALFCVLLVITAVLIGFGLIAMKLWRRSRAGREDESGVPRMSVADMMA